MWRIRRAWFRLLAFLSCRQLCIGCHSLVPEWAMRRCPTCGLWWCRINCYGEADSDDDQQCSCCEYPDG